MKNANKPDWIWCVYLLKCGDKSLYCGITKDIVRRLRQHNAGKGAKYTRSRLPVSLLRRSVLMSHGDALRLEMKIKKMPRDKKLDALL